jgi:hypothetical protein
MPIRRHHRLFALAPLLACLATTAIAQGERQWVDPPVAPPASPPPPEPAPVASAFDDALGSRGKSLESRRNQEARNPPVIRSAARPPSTPPQSDAPRKTVSPPVQRDAKADVHARRHPATATPRPSFNCRAARAAVERAICADPVLAAKDRRMALLYEEAGGSRRGPVDPTQWRWLAARNACGRAPALSACIDRIYDARIAELSRPHR